MNGPSYRFQVFVSRYIEEMIEVDAETEHEAITSIQGPKDKVLYVRKLEPDAPTPKPRSRRSRVLDRN